MPTSTPSDTTLYAALIAERYGQSLDEIVQEQSRRPLPELLREQYRRPVPAQPPQPRRPGARDPEGPARLQVLANAIAPHRRSVPA